MAKKFLCKIGIHQLLNDSVGTNIGSDNIPIYIFTTYKTCNHCPYTTRPQK